MHRTIHRRSSTLAPAVLAALVGGLPLATQGSAIASHDLRFDWLVDSNLESSTSTENDLAPGAPASAGTGGVAQGPHGFNGILTRSDIAADARGRPEIKALMNHSFELSGVDESNLWLGVTSTTENKALLAETIALANAPVSTEFRATFFWHVTGSFLVQVDKPLGQDPLLGAEATFEFSYESDRPSYPSRDPLVDSFTRRFVLSPRVIADTHNEFRGTVDEMVTVDMFASDEISLAHQVALTTTTFLLNDGASLNFEASGQALHDFASTATLTGVMFRDLAGNVLPDIRVSSPGGFFYEVLGGPSAGVSEPEPLSMLGLGMLAVGGAAAARRRTRPAGRRS